MKKIIMVRHATAAPKGADVDDFTRPLRKKGHKECRAMVRWYRDNVGEIPDLMLSSPAYRALETARFFAKGLGHKAKKIKKDKLLYTVDSPERFLEMLKALDDKHGSVMLFGHDPAFSEFAQYMVAEFGDVLPKCSVLGFAVNRKSWKTMKSGDGKLEFLELPGALQQQRARAKQVRRETAERIEEGIWHILAGFGIGKTDEDSDGSAKTIRRASARIAESLVHRLNEQPGEAASSAQGGERSGKETAE
jgi:phosphohistidine phosphatase